MYFPDAIQQGVPQVISLKVHFISLQTGRTSSSGCKAGTTSCPRGHSWTSSQELTACEHHTVFQNVGDRRRQEQAIL